MAAQCPLCKMEVKDEYRPFCSKRCADIDLGRWFKGIYAIPTEEEPGVGESTVAARDDNDDVF